MQTIRAKSCPRLKMSVARVAPVAVATCLALAALVPASGATYYWDPNLVADGIGGSGTWSTSADFAYFTRQTDGSGDYSPWSGTTNTAVFGGVIGSSFAVEIGGGISVNQLTVLAGNAYSFSGSELTIVGDPGVITVNSGAQALFNTTISATALELDGGGTFVYGRHDLFGNATAINLMAGTTIDLAGHNDTVGAFTLTDGVVASTGAAGVVTASSYAVKKGTVNAILAGNSSVNLTKSGTGTVTLNAVNSYAGLTTINSGTLAINGTNSGSGNTIVNGGVLALSGTTHSANITVNSGAVLSGTGRAYSAIALGGSVSPGSFLNDDVGQLTTNSQIWNSGGIYNWNITNAGGVAGTGWDLLYLSGGSLTINSGFTLQILGLSTAGFDSTKSYGWLIADSIYQIVGVNEPVAILGGGSAGTFSLVARAGTSNLGLYLDYTPVPEPKDYAMILGAITLGLVGYRRWRRTTQYA